MSRLLLVSLLLASINSAYACTGIKIKSKTQLWKQQACLRGANMFQQSKYASIKNVWHPKITQQDLVDLRQAGANFVNYSVPGIYNVNDYSLNKKYLDKLQQLIEYARNADLFVVISYRTAPGRGEGNITDDGIINKQLFYTPKAQAAFVKMWQKTAQVFKNEKTVIGYDLLVEPYEATSEAWRMLAQSTVNAVRAVDEKTPILVAAPGWSGVDSLKNFKPLKGEGLFYTVHQYEPFEYTHKNNGQYDYRKLKNQYDEVKQWQDKHTAHVVVNEFGVANQVRDAKNFLIDQINLLEKANINHSIWLWEVEYDPSYNFQQFDFKDQKELFDAIKKNWRRNEVYPHNISL